MSNKHETATTIPTAASRAKAERLYLLVLHDGHFVTQPLPESGDVVIGRSERCDVRIQDPSISRQHAQLRIENGNITVTDLDSVNGTEVREKPIAKGMAAPVATNEAFTVGNVTLVVQQRSTPVRSRRMWSHDYFEGRVAEECSRAEGQGTSFAVVRLRFPEPTEPPKVQAQFSEVLRDVDIVGRYGPSEYEILLLDATADESQLVTDRLSKAFDRTKVTIGSASFPRDGRDADKLIARASSVTRKKPAPKGDDDGVVLRDPTMQNLYNLARRVAAGTINVLILGETGVGKQVLAEFIHKASPRKDKPFLELNCSAFSESLLESELFGHEKGAFTGAVASKPGLLETAKGGTVFLDEIGDMALPLQAKLLRVIENRQVMRVGGLKNHSIDVRFVAATNRELEADVMAGTFRQDLYFRINGVTLEVPPLRDRSSEVPDLAVAFISDYCGQVGQPDLTLTDAATAMLQAYSWPGNIRELRNVIERATLLATGSEITPEHLPVEKMTATFATPVSVASAPAWPRPAAPSMGGASAGGGAKSGESREEKRQRILAALMECGGNNTEAAKILGVSRRTLGKWLEAYDIPRPRKRRSGKGDK